MHDSLLSHAHGEECVLGGMISRSVDSESAGCVEKKR